MRIHIGREHAWASEKSGSSENASPVHHVAHLWDRIRKLEYDNEAAAARIMRLEADLNECLEFLEGQSDVVDGDYGEPSPNRAMQLISMIDETLNGRPI